MGSVRDDYKRFVLNGRKERAGAFLRESNLCLKLRMNIENTMRYMDLKDKRKDQFDFDDFLKQKLGQEDGDQEAQLSQEDWNLLMEEFLDTPG